MFKLLLAAAALLTVQSASIKWQVIDISREKSRVLMIDTASRPVTPSRIVSANVFVTVDMPGLAALQGVWEIDCEQHLHRVVRATGYDRAGKPTGTDTNPQPWAPTLAGTLFEGAEDYICQGKTDYPGKLVTGVLPIAEANALLKN